MIAVAEINFGNYLLDSTAFMVMLATILNILPPVAAIVSITLMGIRIYETSTVQGILLRYRMQKILRKAGEDEHTGS